MCLVASWAVALTSPLAGISADSVKFSPGSLQMQEEANTAALPGPLADNVGEAAGQEGAAGGREFLIAPLPSRNGLTGWTLVVPAGFLYRPSGVAKEDPAWISGAGAFYAENESWGVGVFHKMNLANDAWRLMGAAFYTDLKYDYFGIGGGGDESIPLRQPATVIIAEGLREATDGLYLGMRLVYTLTDVRLDIPEDDVPPELNPPRLNEDITLMSVAPRVQYDTRDSEFYPTSGFLVEGQVSLGAEALGGDSDYQIYDLAFNHYRKTGSVGVLAMRAAVKHAAGDVPFFLLPAFGSGGDLRGYTPGSHRDRFLFAAQVEYRHRFTPSIGAVAFAGVGTVSDSFGSWGETLPSGGIGLRWVLAEKSKVSLRVDYAWGRDDRQFYLSLGEAF